MILTCVNLLIFHRRIMIKSRNLLEMSREIAKKNCLSEYLLACFDSFSLCVK
jgi:hypothetical protein